MTARRFCLALIVAIGAPPPLPASATERVVNFYNWSDYVAPTVFDAFTKETGIAVRYDTFDGNDTLEAKLFAGQSGYDVVVPTAYFLARQIEAGLYRKLDKSRLPNLVYAWPEIADRLAVYDPGNQYAVNYMWGTTGIGYNVKAVRDVLGPDATIDSWDYVFDPEKIKKFKDLRHSLSQFIRRRHVGRSQLSASRSEFGQSGGPRKGHRPSDQSGPTYANSIRWNISMRWRPARSALPWAFPATSSRRSGAPPRPNPASSSVTPSRRKARNCLDNMPIPNDAPHVAEAHALIDYLLRPEVAAKNTNYVFYANGDRPGPFIDAAIRDDRTIYPDATTMARLYTIFARDQKTERLVNRLWTRIKTGH